MGGSRTRGTARWPAHSGALPGFASTSSGGAVPPNPGAAPQSFHSQLEDPDESRRGPPSVQHPARGTSGGNRDPGAVPQTAREDAWAAFVREFSQAILNVARSIVYGRTLCGCHIIPK